MAKDLITLINDQVPADSQTAMARREALRTAFRRGEISQGTFRHQMDVAGAIIAAELAERQAEERRVAAELSRIASARAAQRRVADAQAKAEREAAAIAAEKALLASMTPEQRILHVATKAVFEAQDSDDFNDATEDWHRYDGPPSFCEGGARVLAQAVLTALKNSGAL